MKSCGGNALIARKIGEGKEQESRQDFSLLMAVAFIFSIVLAFSVIGECGGKHSQENGKIR